ncbi:MAG TPA: DeoR family transcriptional regulator [Anaerolineales bacterium]|nr:DeoR family transcriptional regulator [Anaerolineales bacterium]
MSTTSVDREKKLLEYLQEHKSASIQELTEVFGVSNMTIHRDLNKLEKAGHVQKKHGGVILAGKAMGDDACAMCGKPVPARTLFLVKLENGQEKHACCAHCGLMLHSRESDAWQSFTADYLHGHIVSAGQAVYVIESELTVCCVPSVLSFGSQADAKKFQKGFGGRLADMEQTIQHLRGMMHASK